MIIKCDSGQFSNQLDDITWLPSKREMCPSCNQKTCEFVVLSSGTSLKDEIYGNNNEEKIRWPWEVAVPLQLRNLVM